MQAIVYPRAPIGAECGVRATSVQKVVRAYFLNDQSFSATGAMSLG